MPVVGSSGFLGVSRNGGPNGLFRARVPEPGGGEGGQGVRYKEMNSFTTAEAAARWYDATALDQDKNVCVHERPAAGDGSAAPLGALRCCCWRAIRFPPRVLAAIPRARVPPPFPPPPSRTNFDETGRRIDRSRPPADLPEFLLWSSGRFYVKRGEHLGLFRLRADAVAAAAALQREADGGAPVPADLYGSLTARRRMQLECKQMGQADPPPLRQTTRKRGARDGLPAAGVAAAEGGARAAAAAVAATARTSARGRTCADVAGVLHSALGLD